MNGRSTTKTEGRHKGRIPEPATDTRPRWIAVAVAVAVVVAAGTAVGIRVATSRDTAPPSSTIVPPSVEELRREIGDRLAAPGSPVPTADAVALFQAGIDRLLQLPAVDVSYSAEGTDAGRVQAEGMAVPATKSLTVRRTTALPDGASFTEERRVVNGTIYVRLFDKPGPAAPVPWDQAPVAAQPQPDYELIFTGGGRAGRSLQQLSELLRTASFTATRLSADNKTYRLSVPARGVEEYYESKMGHPVDHGGAAPGTSAFEFTINDEGALTGLAAYGTVYQDDEPVEPALVEVRYRAASPSPITPPPPEELRP